MGLDWTLGTGSSPRPARSARRACACTRCFRRPRRPPRKARPGCGRAQEGRRRPEVPRRAARALCRGHGRGQAPGHEDRLPPRAAVRGADQRAGQRAPGPGQHGALVRPARGDVRGPGDPGLPAGLQLRQRAGPLRRGRAPVAAGGAAGLRDLEAHHRRARRSRFHPVPTFTIYEASRDVMRARNADWMDDYVPGYMARAFEPNPEIHGSYFFDWTTQHEIDWKRNFRAGCTSSTTTRTPAARGDRAPTRASSTRSTALPTSASWSCCRRPASIPWRSSRPPPSTAPSCSASTT
jgi:hypothetical protein